MPVIHPLKPKGPYFKTLSKEAGDRIKGSGNYPLCKKVEVYCLTLGPDWFSGLYDVQTCRGQGQELVNPKP